jgi:transcriptional regulator with XRE-family HTH domain
MEITAQQLRSARAYLDLARNDVAAATGVGTQTLADLENGKTDSPRISTLDTLRLFYETRGVEFTDDGGIRPRKVRVIQFQGAEGFQKFMDDVYETVKDQGGEVCLHNANPSNWIKWLGVEWNTMHTQRMLGLGKLNFKITAGHDDFQMIGKHAEYRWLPPTMWNDQSFYAYGDRMALLNFEDNSVHIVVMHNRKFADGFRTLFNVAWNTVSITPPPKGS